MTRDGSSNEYWEPVAIATGADGLREYIATMVEMLIHDWHDKMDAQELQEFVVGSIRKIDTSPLGLFAVLSTGGEPINTTAPSDLLTELQKVLPLVEWAVDVVDPLFKAKAERSVSSIRAAIAKATT